MELYLYEIVWQNAFSLRKHRLADKVNFSRKKNKCKSEIMFSWLQILLS